MASTATTNIAGPSRERDSKDKDKDKGYSVLSRGRRPSPPARVPSYSKRHASFDSPREVPLPSPSASRSGGGQEYSYFDVKRDKPQSPRNNQKSFASQQKEKLRDNHGNFTPVFEEEDGSEWTLVDKQLPKLSLSTQGVPTPPHTNSAAASGAGHLYETHGLLPTTSQIHPFPRPYSLPHSSSSGSGEEVVNAPRLSRSRTEDTGNEYLTTLALGANPSSNRDVDRSSSASLPLPAQIPFHTLPKVGEVAKLVGEVARSRVPEEAQAESSSSSTTSADRTSSRPGSSSGSSSGTLPSAPDTRSPSPPKLFRSPPPNPGSGNPNMPSIRARAFHSQPPQSTPPSRPPSSSYDPDDYTYDSGTALRRKPPSIIASTAGYPPPEPPTILPPPNPPPNMGGVYAGGTQTTTESSNTSMTANMGTATGTNANTATAEAPIPRITNASDLPPVLPPSRTRRSVPSDFLANSTNSNPPSAALPSNNSYLNRSNTGGPNSNPYNPIPPYAPFLSHMPPPADSWIEVETTPAEYRLNIRLPGFKRDGITLATKRRRILHVVADSWPDSSARQTQTTTPLPSIQSESASGQTGTTNNDAPHPPMVGPQPQAPQGGHFERRISFGYDADLVGVRAEFDGDMLRIVVPRRQMGQGGASSSPFF